MKTILSIICLLSMTAVAQAKCPSTQESKAAKNLKLQGKANVTMGSKVSEDTVSMHKSNTKLYKDLKSFIAGKDLSIISNVFMLAEAGSIGAVVQNTKSCDITFFGTDGEGYNNSIIKEIRPGSITFQYHDGGVVTVSTENSTAAK